MLLRFAGLTQVEVAKKLSASLRWIAQTVAEGKYKKEYDNFRKIVAENYLDDAVKENPEESLVKWYPTLLTKMHDIAKGKKGVKQSEIRAIKELIDLASKYREKIKPERIAQPLMSDEKAGELHEDIKSLIPLHIKLMKKLNECGRKNCKLLPKILESS